MLAISAARLLSLAFPLLLCSSALALLNAHHTAFLSPSALPSTPSPSALSPLNPAASNSIRLPSPWLPSTLMLRPSALRPLRVAPTSKSRGEERSKGARGARGGNGVDGAKGGRGPRVSRGARGARGAQGTRGSSAAGVVRGGTGGKKSKGAEGPEPQPVEVEELPQITPFMESQILNAFSSDIDRTIQDIIDETAGKQKIKPKSASPKPQTPGLKVSTAKLLEYERKGHIKVPKLVESCGFDLGDIQDAFEYVYETRALEAYTQKMRVFGLDHKTIESFTTAWEARDYLMDLCEAEEVEIPFLQLFHLHQGDSEGAKLINDLATSEILGKVASDIMGTDAVLLYQTACFVKEPGHGETAWHSDLNTAPFDTNSMITFWIPLTNVPTDDFSPLEFASESHRDFALPYWYSNDGMEDLGPRGYTIDNHTPLKAGDATAHHGWLLHASPPNFSEIVRKALTITFVGSDTKRLPKEGRRREPDDEDLEGYRSWIGQIKPGELVSKALPTVYDKKRRSGVSESE